ncbi:L-serine ammonia-lyase, iron-sulfur-dependent, subunit alpha [Cohnella sp. GCM10027633]|uniref:L-serine ammonia-lyase, iron-sulfur-dependent, subunit alpha n=1 Tax=unclassified Cohnella TaxID=2636738 RepID=UPI003639B353
MRFRTLRELADLCAAEGKTIARLMLEEQANESGRSVEEEWKHMASYYAIMKEAVRKGVVSDRTSRGGLVGGDAKRVHARSGREDASLGTHAGTAMAYALAVSEVNASMGRIVATPTAGSCGVIPGVFVSSQERFGWDDRILIEGLFSAGAIGYVIANRSFISGAEGGCQAEIGSAIGMAAGALVEMMGGDPHQAVHAVGLALKNTLGLICDPVAGLVEVPCVVRNGFGAVNALAAADMALAGVRSAIPSDEVIQVMKDVGNAMPDIHRETARGGLAMTPTGKEITRQLARERGEPSGKGGDGDERGEHT